MRQGLRAPSWAEVWPLVRAEPLAFRRPRLTLRRVSRSPVLRLVSHLLIRLLILSAFPPQYQAWAVLFPVSMLWSVVGQKEAAAPDAGAAAACSEKGWGASGAERKPQHAAANASAGGLTEAGIALRRATTKVGMEPRVGKILVRHGSFTCTAPAGVWQEWSARGRGVVLSLTADNDGALSSELPGGLDDRMLVTVTDPLGRTQSLTITKYVDLATGRTSIGATGGVVEGPGGVELRLPDGAVDRGVVFKIQALSPASIPLEQRPEIPDSHLGAVLRIEAPSMPRFRKEVDLVFPKPADAPAGAFYYVYRKILGPDGVVIHEALDSASVQGAKVVTNSPPFSGYTDSVGAFAFGVGGLAVMGVMSSITYLMWTINSLLPGRASAGAISGSVLCGRWNRSTGQYDYVGVPGAIVRPIWGEQDPVLAGGTVTRSGADGGYAFFEGRYSGGGIKLRATIPASLVGCAGTKDAMGYGAPKPTWALSYTAYATANITFTAEGEVPPEPRVDIRLLKQVDGAWRFSEGVETTGQALLIGVTVAEATLSEARVDGDLLTLRDAVPEHLGMAQVADYTPGTTGVHTVTIKVNPAQGSPVTVSSSFLAIADGSDNNTPLPGRPEVIALASVPRNGAKSVPVTVLPEIRFTEPVKNVPGNLTLTEVNSDGTAGDAVSFSLFGVGPDGPVTEVTALSVVSSLTLQPSNSLEHGKKYRLSLTDAIVDLDPDPEGSQPLVPFTSEFETYDPTVVGTSGETYTSAGVVVSGERAYVLENQFERGLLRTYDVSDPEQPRELGGPWMVLGRAVDLKGEKASPVLPENPDIVVAGTTVNWRSRPSNLHVYDVSSGRPWEIGAVSVSASSLGGTLSRFVVKGTRAFTITWHRGVQEVDLTRAVQNYQATDFFTRNRDMNTSGRGFAMNAVMQTIPVLRAPNQHWLMRDLKVGDYVQDGQSQPIVWVTGDLGLAWVNPQAGGHGPPLTLSLASGRRLEEGTALALGRLGNRDVAVVVGGGAIKDANGVDVPGSVLAVVDLGEVLHPSTPAKPKVLSIIPLFGGDFVLGGQPQDVLLVEHMAVVSSATNAVIVDLGTGEAAGTAPAVIGALDGVAGRLALSDDGLLFSSAYSVLGNPDALGRFKVSALGEVAFVKSYRPDPIRVSVANEVFADTSFTYKLIPHDDVQDLAVQVGVRGGGVVDTVTGGAVAANGTGTLVWPQGRIVNPQLGYQAKVRATRGGHLMNAVPKPLRMATVPIGITTRDRLLRIQVALPHQGLYEGERKYKVEVYLARQDQVFPTTPAFLVDNRTILSAAANVETWTQGASPGERWMTLKIDKMALPPGTDIQIRRQAFEIGTVLAGYPKVRVVVVCEDTGVPLSAAEGLVAADGGWSQVVTSVNDKIRLAAGLGLGGIPAPGDFDPGRLYEEVSALTYRVFRAVIDETTAEFASFFSGFSDGFWESLKGEADLPAAAARALRDPKGAMEALSQQCQEIVNLLRSFDTQQFFMTALRAMRTAEPVTQHDVFHLRQQGAYVFGYIHGVVWEQLVLTFAVAVTTASIGVLVEKAGLAVRVGQWTLWLGARALAAISTLIRWLNRLAEIVGTVTPAMVRTAFSWIWAQRAGLELLWGKYLQGPKLVGALVECAQASKEAAELALKWLNLADTMAEEAAARFVRFFEKKGGQVAEAWMTRWAALTHGKRAVKDAFEAYDKTGDAADTVHHVLVVTANLDEAVPRKYVGRYKATAQGDRVESSLGRLRQSMDDTRFSDESISETLRALSATDLRALSDDAVEGSARFMSQAGSDLTAEGREVLLGRMIALPEADSEALLVYLKSTPEPKAPQGVRSLLEATGVCP